MINDINPQQMQGLHGFHRPDPAQMFNDLSTKVGADDDGITKDDLENYLQKLQDDGKGNGREAKFISKMVENFDTLSGGSDHITADRMKTGMESLRPQIRPSGTPSGPPPGMSNWQDSSTITSDQLQSPIDIRV